jgi:hypothetical protein
MTIHAPKSSMYSYHSVKTPMVAKAKPAKKPPERAQAMLELIRAGCTPSDAMTRLERADGHRKLLPPITPENAGSATPKGEVKYPRRDLGQHSAGIMRNLTNDWMTGREMSGILNQDKVHVTYDMMALARDKQIEIRRTSAKAPYEFRRLQK